MMKDGIRAKLSCSMTHDFFAFGQAFMARRLVIPPPLQIYCTTRLRQKTNSSLNGCLTRYGRARDIQGTRMLYLQV
jgi:hypothetical protein